MPVESAATVKIGVVADTHGHVANTQRALALLAAAEVEQVVHCGDIGSEAIPALFTRWPTHFVFGNVDRQTAQLRRAIEAAGHVCHGDFGRINAAGVEIAFLHGHDTARLKQESASGRWRLLCHGHTHRAEQRHVVDTLVLNPGAVYRANPHTVAVVELPALQVQWLEF